MQPKEVVMELSQGRKETHFHESYFQRDKNRVRTFKWHLAIEPTKNLVLVKQLENGERTLVTKHQSNQQQTVRK